MSPCIIFFKFRSPVAVKRSIHAVLLFLTVDCLIVFLHRSVERNLKHTPNEKQIYPAQWAVVTAEA